VASSLNLDDATTTTKRHRAGLAVWSLARFFFLEELVRQRGLINVFQIETDVLVFADLTRASLVFQRNNIQLAASRYNVEDASGALIFVRDTEAVSRLTNALLQANKASPDLSEMALLGLVADSVNMTMLPLLPHHHDRTLALQLGWLASWHVGPWLSGGYVAESVEDPGLEFGMLWDEMRRINSSGVVLWRRSAAGWWPCLRLTSSSTDEARSSTETFPIGLLHIGSKVTGLFTAKTFSVDVIQDVILRPNVSFIVPSPEVPVAAGDELGVELSVRQFQLSDGGYSQRMNGWPFKGLAEVWFDGVSVGQFASTDFVLRVHLTQGAHELAVALWSPDEHVYVSFVDTVVFHVGQANQLLSSIGSLVLLMSTPYVVRARREGAVTKILASEVTFEKSTPKADLVSDVHVTRAIGTLLPVLYNTHQDMGPRRLLWTECSQSWASGECSVWSAPWDEGHRQHRIHNGWLASPPSRLDGSLVAVVGEHRFFGHSLTVIFSPDNGATWLPRGEVKVPFKKVSSGVVLMESTGSEWIGGWLTLIVSLRGVSLSYSVDGGSEWSPVTPLPSTPFAMAHRRGIPGSRHLWRVHFLQLSPGRLLRLHVASPASVHVSVSQDPSVWGRVKVVSLTREFSVITLTLLEIDDSNSHSQAVAIAEDPNGATRMFRFVVDWDLLRVESIVCSDNLFRVMGNELGSNEC